jgi:hypothetical protein
VRQLTDQDLLTLRDNIRAYVRRGEHYRDNLKRLR